MNHETYDCEIYPNLFTICFKPLGKPYLESFEISERRDERRDIIDHIKKIDRMIGFNNLGFDWPLLNYLIENPDAPVFKIYELAQHIIDSDDRFSNIIWNPIIEQLDLFRLHHFDNRAKQTSLKTVEFNLRMQSIRDLPFEPGSYIRVDDIDEVLKYNGNDVLATEKLFEHSREKIAFRESINRKWLNYSDSKIGKQYVIDALKASNINCFEFDENNRRRPRQTLRPDGVNLADIIFPWITFKHPCLQELLDDVKQQTMSETNWALDRKFEFGKLKMSFGLGGIHGSVNRRRYVDGVILDLDVISYYPSIAIVNKLYPEHLGVKFCDVYEQLFERRKTTKKGTSDNAALKLGLNSVFGDSNNPYGPFFDPAYMLGITINGQLMLLMLAEELLQITRLELIQINTDGLTIRLPKNQVEAVRNVADGWELTTGMTLEKKQYRRLFIRDVNNYIGEFTDGERKRKGAYEHKRELWQNHSGLVIPRGAEAVLLDDADAETFVAIHPDSWDFMFRVKTNKGSRIEFDNGLTMKGTIRYYLSENGATALKIMPKTQARLHASGFSEPQGKRGNWNCPECNFNSKRKADIKAHIGACHASKLVVCQDCDDEPIPIDNRPYVVAIESLTMGFK